MEAFLITARQLGIMSVLFFAGYYIMRKGYITDETVKGLSFMMLNIFMPSTVLISFQMDYAEGLLSNGMIMIIGFIIIMLLGYFIALLLTRVLKISGNERRVWFGSSMIYNCLFIGLPIIDALYGDKGVLYLSFGIVGWNLVTYSLGIQVFKEKGGERDLIGRLRKILLTPGIIVCVLGMIVFMLPFKLPSMVLESFRYLSNATVPVSMLVSGALASKSPLKELFTGKNVYVLSAVRLIIIPLIALLALSVFIKDEIALSTLVLSAAMPVAITVPVFSEQFAGAGEIGAKYWVVTTILSLISLPVISFVISVF